MRLILPSDMINRLEVALQQAGEREIGGVLMGEHIGPNIFRVVDLTIQSSGGNTFFFLRQISAALSALSSFFQRTRHEYRRFNYLGEWHSHPQYLTQPSATDSATMREILEDRTVGATFAVLLIVRLDQDRVTGNAFVYLLSQPETEAEVVWETL